MTNIGKTNYFLSPNENFIILHESFATKKPVQVIVRLPSSFNTEKYVGRVYSLRLSWSFFNAILRYNPSTESDITDPQTANLTQDFAFDTTWKYRIEPYDPTIPQPTTIEISPTFPYALQQELDETNNRIIYTLDTPPENYTIVRLDIELSSVYPKKQCPQGFEVRVLPKGTESSLP